MPDTGAPWNIPYVAGTDLVSDWPTDSQTLAEAVADGLDAANLGIGTNVVQAVKTDTFVTSSGASGTWVDVTGLTATITPSTNTSKILVIVTAQVSSLATSNESVFLQLTGGNTATFVGDAASNRQRTVWFHRATSQSNPDSQTEAITTVYLDSPATTSAVTYGVQVRNNVAGGLVYINRSAADTDNDDYGRSASTITVIEVAA